MLKDCVFDLDGVLCGFYPRLLEVVAEQGGPRYQVSDVYRYDFDKNLGFSGIEDFLSFVVENKILESAAPAPGAREILSTVREMGYKAHIVTARGYHPEALSATQDWLDRHGIVVDSVSISHGDKKKAFRAIAPKHAFFIDDFSKNINDAAETGLFEELILMDQPWNQAYRGPGRRLESLSDLPGLLGQLFKVNESSCLEMTL